MSDSTPPPEDEVTRLQEETAVLRAQLDTRERRRRRVLTTRRVVAAVLVALAALGLTASVVGVWSARTALNTDKWVERVGPLQDDPEVRAAVATYVSTEIYSALDVEERLTQALPPEAAFLAAPLSTEVRDYLKKAVLDVMDRPRFDEVWLGLNRVAHEQMEAILTGDSELVQQRGDNAVLILLPVVNDVLRELDQAVPTIFGRDVQIPELTSTELPDSVRDRLSATLGVTIPANFGEVVILRGDELEEAQDAVVATKRGLLALVVGSLLLLALAFWVSPRRRRTVLQLGIWLAVWVVVLTKVLQAVRDQLLEGVPAGVYRDGAESAIKIVFTSLREYATLILWLGAVMAVAAYLVGPGRFAVALRVGVARGGRGARRLAAVAVAAAPGHVRAHLDGYRVAGVVAAVVVTLVLPSWSVLFTVVVLLGLYELGVTLLAASAPAPEPGPAEGSAAGAFVPGQQGSRTAVGPGGDAQP